MPVQPRSVLRPLFAKGQRPKEQHFHDWLDSFYHKDEDSVNIKGWLYRSFFKDLRGEGTAISAGGSSMVDIPFGVSRLKAIKVFGNGQRLNPLAQLVVTVSLIYISDVQIASLNGVFNDIPQMPQGAAGGFFRHALVGNLAPVTFPITSAPAPTGSFSGVLNFAAPGLPLTFLEVRFFRLAVDVTSNINFPGGTNNFIYYGFQYE